MPPASSPGIINPVPRGCSIFWKELAGVCSFRRLVLSTEPQTSPISIVKDTVARLQEYIGDNRHIFIKAANFWPPTKGAWAALRWEQGLVRYLISAETREWATRNVQSLCCDTKDRGGRWLDERSQQSLALRLISTSGGNQDNCYRVILRISC